MTTQPGSVLRIEPAERLTPVFDGRSFGPVGTYQCLSGTILGERDMGNGWKTVEVSALGVRDFAVGDRVVWTQVPGSYAEQVAVDARQAVPVPEGVDLKAAANPPPATLPGLQSRWLATRPDLEQLRSPAEADLPDAIMDVVFQIEQQTAASCGPPQGLDLALLLISKKREAASQ